MSVVVIFYPDLIAPFEHSNFPPVGHGPLVGNYWIRRITIGRCQTRVLEVLSYISLIHIVFAKTITGFLIHERVALKVHIA